MKTVVMYIDWPDRYRFFKRLLPGLRSQGIKGVFLTNKLALHRRAEREGIDSELIVRSTSLFDVDLSESLEILSQVLTRHEALKLYAGAWNALHRIIERESVVSAVFVWNGSGVAARSLTSYCQDNDIDQLYFEISNLPGKLFVDGAGVNAKSILASDVAILDQFDVDETEFTNWLESYIEDKLNTNVLPQAKILDQISFIDTITNRLGFLFFGVPTDDNTSLLKKLVLSKKRKNIIDTKEAFAGREKYIFLPLQVSSDSQILLNSDVGNLDAIKYALGLAEDKNYSLIVKSHPAERDVEEVQRVRELQEKVGFCISNDNTLDLIQNAEMLVTINSTVGLEAILLGKPVEFLGRTFYQYFLDKRRLAQYVLGYLIDIDYFADDEIDRDLVAQLIGRIASNRRYHEDKLSS